MIEKAIEVEIEVRGASIETVLTALAPPLQLDRGGSQREGERLVRSNEGTKMGARERAVKEDGHLKIELMARILT